VTPGAGTPATTPPAHDPLSSTPAPAPRAHAAGYRVDLSWGSAGAPRGLHDVARLTPLESNGQPAVVFMGVRPDGKTALFLLIADDGGGSGDAHCRPSVDLCRMLEMQAGDTQFLDVATTDGMRQYELHVDRVSARTAATPAAADRLRGRVSKAGRKLVTDTIDSGRTFVSLYRYAPARGVVVFSPSPPSKRAAASALGELQRVQGPPAQ
ncbi:MAG: hypothetical protein JWM73_510, partial [Solirubrobacterales bacterium]|nr:hypothetical protein [Solirubrobacterales bacterium]